MKGAGPPPTVAPAPSRPVKGWLIAGEAAILVRRRQRALHEELVRRGIDCRLEVVVGLGHSYPVDFASRLPRALGFVTAATPQ